MRTPPLLVAIPMAVTAGAASLLLVQRILASTSKCSASGQKNTVDGDADFTADVRRVVAAYGLAWQQQNKKAIGQLFTENGEYCERPFHPTGTYEGRASIVKYWERQIIMKQKDIHFTAMEEDYVIDFRERKALVKWHASFVNRLAYTKKTNETKRVEFVQVAILTFSKTERCPETRLPLISRLEEYWHSVSSAQCKNKVNLMDEDDDCQGEEADAGKTKLAAAGPLGAAAPVEDDERLNVKSRVARKKTRRTQSAFAAADAIVGNSADDASSGTPTGRPAASGLKERYIVPTAVTCQAVETNSKLVSHANRFSRSSLTQDPTDLRLVSQCWFWLGWESDEQQEDPLLPVTSRMIAYFELTIDPDCDCLPSLGIQPSSVSPGSECLNLARVWNPDGTVTSGLSNFSGVAQKGDTTPFAVGQTTFHRGDTVGMGWDAVTQKLFLTKNGELRNGLMEVIPAPGVFDLCPVVLFPTTAPEGKCSVTFHPPDCCKFRLPFWLRAPAAPSSSSGLSSAQLREAILGEKTRVALMDDLPTAVRSNNGTQLALIWTQILLREGEKKGAKSLRFWCEQNKALVSKSGAESLVAELLGCICGGKSKRHQVARGDGSK